VEGEGVSCAIGAEYEQMASEICEMLGYQVIKPAKQNHAHWDRMINGHRTQIKKRWIDPFSKNRVRLVTGRSSSVIVCTTADVDAFAIYWGAGWYVFPADRVCDREGVIRNGIHMPALEAFKDRWDVLAGAKVDYDRQSEFGF
jgi:hypothetical protein